MPAKNLAIFTRQFSVMIDAGLPLVQCLEILGTQEEDKNFSSVILATRGERREIVDYYLDLMPGVIGSHARRRLFLVAPLDASPRPLALKLLERPRLIEQIRGLILAGSRAR